MATRVAIIDDHYLLRFGIKYMLKLDPGLEFAGEAADADDSGFVDRVRPDVLLLDLYLPRKSGMEAFREIRAAHPDLKVIVLTTSEKEEDVYRCIRGGVDGYLLKDSRPAEIIDGIRKVAAGGKCIPEKIRSIYAMRKSEKGLSEREAEVLGFVSKGLSNPEIAKLANVSVETVKSHIKSAFSKLGVSDRAEAVCVAIARGIL